MDDAEAIRLSTTDPPRFSVVFERHATAVHNYVARRIGRDAADDVLSEVFLTAFRRRGSFQPASDSARP